MNIDDFPVATSLDDVKQHFDQVKYANVGMERVSDDDFDVYENFESFKENVHDIFGDEIFEDKVYLIDDVKLNPCHYTS